jgi:hypothetical protein
MGEVNNFKRGLESSGMATLERRRSPCLTPFRGYDRGLQTDRVYGNESQTERLVTWNKNGSLSLSDTKVFHFA